MLKTAVRTTIWTAIVFCLIISAAIASSPPVGSFEYRIEPVAHERCEGAVTLRLSFSPRYTDCQEIVGSIEGKYGVQNLGEESWSVRSEKALEGVHGVISREERPHFEKDLNLYVPPNDTSELWVTLQCVRTKQVFRYFFVTTEDTIEFWGGDPRDPGIIRKKTENPRERRRLVSPDNTAVTRFFTALKSMTRDEERLLMLEEISTETATNRLVEVDGQIYNREKGQREFILAKLDDAERERLARQLDTQDDIPADLECDMLVYMEDTVQMREVRRWISGDMTSTKKPGWFVIKVTGANLKELRKLHLGTFPLYQVLRKVLLPDSLQLNFSI